MTAPLLVGFDVGGSKIALRAVDPTSSRTVLNHISATERWRGEEYGTKARLLVDMLLSQGIKDMGSLAVGAHGCDTQEQCRFLEGALKTLLPIPVRVVNDAQLLSYAAGKPDAIGVISGTGSIAVGTTAADDAVFAGGHGWMVGDDGGATGLVREAVRAALIAADAGRTDHTLERALTQAAGVSRITDLSSLMMTQRPEQWARLAPVIFSADAAGSPLARAVIQAAAASLAALTVSVIRKGALAEDVVLGGSVITSQPVYAAEVRSHLLRELPGVRIHLLQNAPVDGAIAIAGDLVPSAPAPLYHS
ncbi:BadF/BadG/BcrA/BcrD ATPase family protein [Arthrobacter sp. ov118]|uniref:BadF/BadG/BcrA/BcrD ATPase family protein n=1 Tax=Arthrobacter sp. ov118 TaxID=1761747 RepID=UPI0008F1C151|nr:BadF/BadG/BcrA/BcrD ATPase family protein [Arthrobacter sp. ov118]SFU11375.1 BadF/BadG/BcrA/BcrD ATPase family protein [Arthrobacter sp. ov118]